MRRSVKAFSTWSAVKSSNIPRSVKICEVGPRDGLQNEKTLISTKDKVNLIHLLSKAGIKNIESAAFVSPKWVPQMADAAEVLQLIERTEGVTYSALVPNSKGLEKALENNVNEVAVFAAASEAFSQKNINCSIEESLERFVPVLEKAKANAIPVRGYVSCVLGCPYQGNVAHEDVIRISEKLLEMGCYEISLGDTIGVGTPGKTAELLESLLRYLPRNQLAVHFHDTYGQAIGNIFVSLMSGISVIDSSIGGLGGCPYAKGASGNVATEDVVYMLDDMGISTGVDMIQLLKASKFVDAIMNRPLVSKAATALLSKIE